MNSLARYIGSTVRIIIDRPLGSAHPKFGFSYPVNYGYVPDTQAADGEPIDAYVLGVNEPLKDFTGQCIAVIHRTDDDDDKLVVVSESSVGMTDVEIFDATRFQEKFFTSYIIRNSK